MGEDKNNSRKIDGSGTMAELMEVRRSKLDTCREMGVAPFGHRYDVTYHAQQVIDEFDEIAGEEDGGGKRKNFFHDIPRKLNRTRLEILLFGNSENKRGNFVLYKKQRHRRFGLLDGDVLKIK